MAEAVLNDDPQPLMALIRRDTLSKQEKQKKEQERRQAILNDPMNPEHQKMIEMEIAQKQINDQFHYAHENMPETFARVTMLYIDCTINKTKIQAFVDSGA